MGLAAPIKKRTMKTHQRCQEMVAAGSGLEECGKLWQSVLEAFQGKVVSAQDDMESYLKNVLAASWLVGFESQSAFVSTPANGMGCLRVLTSGEVSWVLFEMSSLLAGLRVLLGADKISMDVACDAVKNLDASQAAKLRDAGCKMYHVKQAPQQILWVPAGFLAAERCAKGILIYGLRNSFLYSSEMAAQSYGALVDLYSNSGKPVDKLKATLKLIVGNSDDE